MGSSQSTEHPQGNAATEKSYLRLPLTVDQMRMRILFMPARVTVTPRRLMHVDFEGRLDASVLLQFFILARVYGLQPAPGTDRALVSVVVTLPPDAEDAEPGWMVVRAQNALRENAHLLADLPNLRGAAPAFEVSVTGPARTEAYASAITRVAADPVVLSYLTG